MRALTSIACVIFVGSVGVLAQQPARPAPRKPAPSTAKPAAPAAKRADPTAGPALAGDVFKNVQALKDVSVDDFLPLMGLMTASVGGDCNTCHPGAGTNLVVWEEDTNPLKRKAREMAFMVRAINKDHFGGRNIVTCWTCHRGRPTPIVTPTFDQVYGEPELAPDDEIFATLQGQPRPETIVDRYLQALGGAQKLSAITSYTATGTSVAFRGFGDGAQVTIYAKSPDQRSMIMDFKAQGRDSQVRSFDGKIGWIKTPLNVLGEYQLGGFELDGARLDAQLMGFPGQIKSVLTRMRTIDDAEIDGRQMAVIQGNGGRGLFASLYFDKKTGLLARMVRFGRSPIGRLPTQIDFDDYRDVGGVKMPFKLNFIWLDGRDLIQLNDIKVNVPIDPSKFGRPTALEKKK